jgi:hypothetical protein
MKTAQLESFRNIGSYFEVKKLSKEALSKNTENQN